jgi:hypothetical protein
VVELGGVVGWWFVAVVASVQRVRKEVLAVGLLVALLFAWKIVKVVAVEDRKSRFRRSEMPSVLKVC